MTQEELEYRIEKQKLTETFSTQEGNIIEAFNSAIEDRDLLLSPISNLPEDVRQCWNSRLNSFVSDVLDDVLTLRKAQKLVPLKKD